METILTKQDILKLFALQSEQIEKSRAEFDKRLGELADTWGKFVAEMVQPKIVELFHTRNIQINTSLQNAKGYIGDKRHYEIDLLLK